MAGAVLLLVGLILGFAFSYLLGALLVLVSLGLFGYQATQSIKAARKRERGDEEEEEEEEEDDGDTGEEADEG